MPKLSISHAVMFTHETEFPGKYPVDMSLYNAIDLEYGIEQERIIELLTTAENPIISTVVRVIPED